MESQHSRIFSRRSRTEIRNAEIHGIFICTACTLLNYKFLIGTINRTVILFHGNAERNGFT